MFDRARDFLSQRGGEAASRLGEVLRDLTERLRILIGPAWERLSGRVRTALAPAYAWVYARYQKLEPRERTLVQILGAVLAVFLGYHLIFAPIQDAVSALGDRIQQRQRDAVEVAHMMRTYRQLHADLDTMRTRTVSASGNFSLFSAVEQALSRAPGKDKIGSITPTDKKIPGELTEYTVDVKLNGLTLAQIVDTLYGLGTLNVPVTVSSLHLARRTQDTHTFDVDMTCVALGRNG
jgi:Type II secretion system (T2SS), protein M